MYSLGSSRLLFEIGVTRMWTIKGFPTAIVTVTHREALLPVLLECFGYGSALTWGK